MRIERWSKAYANNQQLGDKRTGAKGGHCRKVPPPTGIAVPKGGPRNVPFAADNKFPIVSPIARYVLPAGESGVTGSQTCTAFVYSPSARLRLSIVACFEPDSVKAVDPSFVVTPTWTIRAMSKNPETGREVPLQLAYPTSGTKNLPDGYELDSAVPLLRVVLTLQDTNFAAAFVPNTERATCQLICTWEPNEPFDDMEELKKLYSQCSVSARQILIANNAA